jgi:hypothetical protein
MRIVKEMLAKLEEQWQTLAPVTLAWTGMQGRSVIAESETRSALLATFDVRGFSETCRVRLAVPSEAFRKVGAAPTRSAKPVAQPGVSLLDVPIRLRAQVGTVELTLAEVGAARGRSVDRARRPDRRLVDGSDRGAREVSRHRGDARIPARRSIAGTHRGSGVGTHGGPG